ncbi:sugar ABC transporter permease [Cellulosilyticum ruminicola]|uniref:sugar ABC transporter permease n=1 Tax=Cellulosilyticum ruminicola TaxID=425254 RepID=UPI0006D063E0|nr:ABC transporter permease subunit [Cellulosilyticum ruminicola]
MSIIWLISIIWIILTSFRGEGKTFVQYFIPKQFTINNYAKLFSSTGVFLFKKWFLNTLIVAVGTCALSTTINLSVAYVMSRMRFKLRKAYMNLALILGMFPGFMSMIAVYYVLKAFNLTQSLLSLVLVYSAGAATSFYIAKGFFDTISKEIDEAARIDGATNAQVFTKIVVPLSKPIIVYTALQAFISPWMDYIFAKIIMGDNYEKYTVAIGLWYMTEKENIENYFTMFAAGSVCIAIPITILFIWLQKSYVSGITGGSVK